jgi:hypothetical protein
MADTPADKPKRRRTTKAAASEPQAETKAPPKRAAPKVESPPKKTPARRAAKPAAPAPVEAKTEKPKRAPRKRAPAAAPTSAPAAPIPAPKPVERVRESRPDAPPRAGLFAALGTLAAIGGAFFVWRATRAEEPDYEVLEVDGAIEVRRYPALVTAGTEQRGQRTRALNDGFRVLADYIFAKSRPGAKLPMTAPVLSDTDGKGSWRTRFIMPTGTARAALPTTPAGVDLVSESSRRVAAIRFSGRADDDILDTKEKGLRSWLQMRSLPSEGRAVHAFYNAPFLPGPLRRNEVMIVLSEEGGMG